jgi:hypothetical protein
MGFAGFPIISTGYHQMAGYDLKTGGRLWHLNNGGYIQVSTSLTPLFLPLFLDTFVTPVQTANKVRLGVRRVAIRADHAGKQLL